MSPSPQFNKSNDDANVIIVDHDKQFLSKSKYRKASSSLSCHSFSLGTGTFSINDSEFEEEGGCIFEPNTAIVNNCLDYSNNSAKPKSFYPTLRTGKSNHFIRTSTATLDTIGSLSTISDATITVNNENGQYHHKGRNISTSISTSSSLSSTTTINENKESSNFTDTIATANSINNYECIDADTDADADAGADADADNNMKPCMYIRATDLIPHFASFQQQQQQQKYHSSFMEPHPMIHLDDDANEVFVALTGNSCTIDDDTIASSLSSSSSYNSCEMPSYTSPILSQVMNSLVQEGLDFISNSTYWSHHSHSAASSSLKSSLSMYFPRKIPSPTNKKPSSPITIESTPLSNEQIEILQKDALLWIGNDLSTTQQQQQQQQQQQSSSSSSYRQMLQSTQNKHNLIAIRTCCIIQTKPRNLYDLMVDSDRIQEYNQYSLGRNDIWVHDNNDNANNNDDDGENDVMKNDETTKEDMTKICHGTNKPPLVRKPIPYMTLMHGEEVQMANIASNESKKGFALATRTVKKVDSNGVMKDLKSYSTEIMIGSTLLLPIQRRSNNSSEETDLEEEEMTLFINANFVKSPMPYYITKKIGLGSSISYVNWLRSAAVKKNQNTSSSCKS